MEFRTYRAADCPALAELFFHTVHTVNAKDYTPSQLNAWATGHVDLSAWNQSFLAHNTLIAEVNGVIAGFGDMDQDGYLDRLYVHKDYQRKGIATSIVNALEQQAVSAGISRFITHASITAKPFFIQRGYCVVRKNTVIRNTVELIQFTMEKSRTN